MIATGDSRTDDAGTFVAAWPKREELKYFSFFAFIDENQNGRCDDDESAYVTQAGGLTTTDFTNATPSTDACRALNFALPERKLAK